MSKGSKRSASNKRLEALMRAQKINEILRSGGIQSQALLDSAGETRPSDESHVVDLLEHERFSRSETSRYLPRIKRTKHSRRPKPRASAKKKHKKRR